MPQRFQGLIRQLGFSEARYVADQRRVSERRQIAGTITAGLEPSKTLIDALSRFQNEQRSIEYIKLDAAQAGAIDPPSPETLATYFDEHKSQFRAPEYRKISFVVITPEELGKWSDVSDEDARKLFEQRRDRLGTPERRQVSRIVFPSAEEAQAARGRIELGLSFDDLAKERGLNQADVDLGMVTKSAILDPAVAEAAFSMPSGEISQPVQGKFGAALVKVGNVQPAVAPTYESVATDIKKEIGTERARTQAATLRDKMEDERGGGASVIEAAQKLGLTATTIEAVDRSGQTPGGQPVTNIPPGLDVVSQAFGSDVGVDNDPISFKGGYVWYDVLGHHPAARPHARRGQNPGRGPLARGSGRNRLRGKATDIVQKLNQGGKLAEEAASIGVKLEPPPPSSARRRCPGVPAGVIAAAFRTAKDSVGQTPGNGGSEWIVFRVTDVSVPPVDFASDEIKKLKETLLRGLTDEQVAQYVGRLQKDIGTSINEAALAQVTGANNN